MQRKSFLLALAAIASQACGGISQAQAQVIDESNGSTIPEAHTCVARNAFTGQFNQVRQRSGSSPFWAHANWDPDGAPSITYGLAYFGLPTLMMSFTSVHECGHLVLRTANEFAANCFALEHLSLSVEDIEEIARIHRQIGALPPQYGGSGRAFWNGTESRCPEFID